MRDEVLDSESKENVFKAPTHSGNVSLQESGDCAVVISGRTGTDARKSIHCQMRNPTLRLLLLLLQWRGRVREFSRGFGVSARFQSV